MLKRILLPVLALVIALSSGLVTETAIHAGVKPHTQTYSWTDPNLGAVSLTFPTGTNNCTGPVVGVYGSSALKTFVLGTAADLCALYPSGAKSSAPDVEYLGGGDSCPGLDMASDNTTDPVVGVSDVFASGCTGTFARSKTLTKDPNNGVDVNAVLAITNCGATTTAPQGGSPFALGVPCTGAAPVSGNPAACASPLPANTFPYPNDMSVLAARNLWNSSSAQAVTDLGTIGGCPGVASTIQLRTPGSGTRATWCYNVFGPGLDTCVGNAPAGNQGGSGGLITAICGNPFTSVAPVDPIGTIGHTSRATVLIDPNNPAAGKTTDSPSSLQPIQQCGIVGLGGKTAWNKRCDPTQLNPGNVPGNGGQTNVSTNSDGFFICNGDLEVSTGNYPAWGYNHVFTHTGNNNVNLYGTGDPTAGGIEGYITYVTAALNQGRFNQYGFIKTCEMNVSRSPDAGPFSIASPTC